MSYVRTSGGMETSSTFAHQPDAFLDQANPVSGTKYTVLNTTGNVRIISVTIIVVWTVQPTPLEIHVTIDGVTWTSDQVNPVSWTAYHMENTDPASAGFDLNATGASQFRAFLLEGRSVKIEAETTGGTVSQLMSRVKYAKK